MKRKTIVSKMLSWLLILGLVLSTVPLTQVPVYAQGIKPDLENTIHEFEYVGYDEIGISLKFTFNIKRAEELALLAILVNNNMTYEYQIIGGENVHYAQSPYSEASYILTEDINLEDLNQKDITLHLNDYTLRQFINKYPDTHKLVEYIGTDEMANDNYKEYLLNLLNSDNGKEIIEGYIIELIKGMKSNWEPIGIGSPYHEGEVTEYISFRGDFDGQGHGISGLKINVDESDNPRQFEYAGLFGRIVTAGTVKNLRLVNVDIKGNDNVGALGGYISGERTVENCYVTGSVAGQNYVGGLVGNLVRAGEGHSLVVKNSYSTCKVTGSDNVGGLVGYKEKSKISNCYATGDVKGALGKDYETWLKSKGWK